MTEEVKPRKPMGFAAMDPLKQKAIASKGGRMAHRKGTANKWDSKTAAEAGRKGGQASNGGRGKHWKPGDPNNKRRLHKGL